MRYLIMVVILRKRLPRRLGRFLHCCQTEAGLLRTTAIAYQFRHRELQDHLAAGHESTTPTADLARLRVRAAATRRLPLADTIGEVLAGPQRGRSALPDEPAAPTVQGGAVIDEVRHHHRPRNAHLLL